MMTRFGDGLGEPPPLRPHGDEDLKRRQEAARKAGVTLTVREAPKD
jgi:hypothetical protein